MMPKRINEKTPNGGDYSEILYFDSAGKLTDEKDAKTCIIRECKKDGTLVHETRGLCK